MKSRVSPVNEHSILIWRQFYVKVRATENRVEREKILHIYVIEIKIFFLEDIVFICNIYDVFWNSSVNLKRNTDVNVEAKN